MTSQLPTGKRNDLTDAPLLHRQPDRVLEPELETLARWMDSVFEIPGLGIRFGLDAIIGLIPGFGDMFTMLASLYILGAARRYGVSRITMTRMAINIAVDSLLGALPILGDIFDVVWKANEKNLSLLRRHLDSPSEALRTSSGDWLFVIGLGIGLVVLLAVTLSLMYWLVAMIGKAIFGGVP